MSRTVPTPKSVMTILPITWAAIVEIAHTPRPSKMAVTEEQAERLFERIEAMDTKIFYIKTPIEYGQLGKQKNE